MGKCKQWEKSAACSVNYNKIKKHRLSQLISKLLLKVKCVSNSVIASSQSNRDVKKIVMKSYDENPQV